MAQRVTVNLEGMSCEGCVKSVERILDRQEGVERIERVEIGEARIVHDESKQSISEILQALHGAKFPASVA